MLEHSVDTPFIGRQVVEVLSGHEKLAGVGGLETGDDSEQRCLSGTAFAQDGEELAFRDVE